LDHQIRKQPWWEQLMTVVGKKGVHRPIGDKVATPARRVQLPIGWVARRTHAGESAHRQPSARTTGSAPPAGSTELRPFSRLLERLRATIAEDDPGEVEVAVPAALAEVDTPIVRAGLVGAVLGLRDAGRVSGEVAAAVAVEQASRSTTLLRASLLAAVAVSVGAATTPAGLLVVSHS
jgi:hypothetical protein